VTTSGGAPIVRTYGYHPASSLMDRMTVTANGALVAGSGVTHDGLQIDSAQLLGVSSNERYSTWRYDDRSRVIASASGVPAAVDPSGAVPGRAKQELTAADFRFGQTRTPRFDATTAGNLAAKGVDTASIDPPSASFVEQTGHKIAGVTKGPVVRPFGWNGAQRVDDGRFTYEFDAKGRLTRATEKGNAPPIRRIGYTYSGTGRVVGRRAEYTNVPSPGAGDWQLEDRRAFLEADGLPADTTLVWDPISDNLLAIFHTSPSPTHPQGGLLRQILHGGLAYDDPIETTSASPSGGVRRLYPIFDEAAAGNLQVVLNEAGAVVARTLPNDPYGGEHVDFTAAAIDRVAVGFRKNETTGELEHVDVTLHATEQLDADSIAVGTRLATVDADGKTARTSTVPAVLDPSDRFTARWTLTAEQWATLTDPTPVAADGTEITPSSLSVAATPTREPRPGAPRSPSSHPPTGRSRPNRFSRATTSRSKCASPCPRSPPRPRLHSTRSKTCPSWESPEATRSLKK
jgi:hypothetical protein